jgi:pilus assembly protein FimV
MLRGTAAAVMGLAVCGGAWALSLGRITLQSTRGEALRAEIELSALSTEEATSLSARSASPEAFSRAGVAYSPALAGAQVSVQQRADGRTVLRIRSDAPVQESFLDLILQIEWASGHITREYTLLFEASQPAAEAPASVAAPVLGAAPAAAPPAPTPAPGKVTPAPADRYSVRRGDTLSGVAVRMQAQGVSLDQLLVALFRSNPHAFVGQNMNRLRADAVLRLPAPDQARQIARGEARQVVRMQSADFNEYRMRLAGLAPAARVEESARRSGGAVEAAVEDRQTAKPAPDRLKLSRSNPGASPEAALAREAERREQSQRVAELSRNVDELKRLATNSPASAVVGKGPAPAAQTASEAASESGASAPAVATAPASAVAQAAAAASAASAPEATAAAASDAMAAPPAAVAPPVQSTGFMGFLERSWALVLGGGVAVLALAGAGVLLWRRRNKPHAETSFLESRLQPESFFGGSPAADAPAAASAAVASDPYSLSQLDAIGDVDPVAEADVYLAYGRDLQAEEILKEALRGHPQRLGIRTKLLEVYAKRHDVKAFEQLAQQVHQITHGQGDDWAKVRDLGLQIDPDNPLYAGVQAPVALAPVSEVPATWMPTEPPPGAGEGLDLDLEQLESVPPVLHEDEIPPAAAEPEPAFAMEIPAEPQQQAEPEIDLGFDIEPEAELQPELALDELSLADEEPVQEQPKTADVGTVAALGAAALPLAQEVQAAEDDLPLLPQETGPSSTLDEDALPELDFGLSDLPDEPLPTRAPQPPAASPSLPFDLDSLSLDLDEPSTSAVLDELNISGFGEEADPLERKLELAEEFRQIGDADGARDLLQEVLAQASGSLKVRAQGMLDSLV